MARSKGHIVDFLKQIKGYLTAANVFNTSTCNLSLDTKALEYPPGDIYCLITPQDFVSWQPSTDGGGVESMILTGSLLFTVWFQNALDEPSRDTTVLTDSVLGVYDKIDDMVNVLQLLDNCHDTSLAYLAEPMRLIKIGSPLRDDKNKEWVKVDLLFEVKIWNLV